MSFTDVVIVGAGQAGLALSRCLGVLDIEHVVLERGGVAERWKTTTWESLRMLTPNWMNGLPWQPYDGADPHGFMTRAEVVSFLERYARRFNSPVLHHTDVLSLDAAGGRYRVRTTRGDWLARGVVIATGHCDVPLIPTSAAALSPAICSLHSSQYRAPGALPEGGVVVVGASASGVQIADELRRTGREVFVSVGRHTRLPRSWRGHDIFWWLTRLGKLGQRTSEIRNLADEIRQPALQLAGRPAGTSLDLPTLQASGVQLVGRLKSVDRSHLGFASDLRATITRADAKMERILDEIDAFASGGRPRGRRALARVDLGTSRPPRALSIAANGIRTVIWATGFRRAFPWVKLPILTDGGEIDHRDGVTSMPGVYALGFRFLRRRNSHFFGAVGVDAWEIATELARFLGQGARKAA